jgi:hypothetical protein
MLPAPTVTGALTRTTSGTAPASGSHTPATNDFLVCVVYASHATNVFTNTATCAGNGQTWTKRVGVVSADTHELFTIFTAGPVASGSAGATTVTLNVATTEAWVGVWNFAAGVTNTLETTTPYVTSGGAAFAAGTSASQAATALSNVSNSRIMFAAHRKGEVTTPRTGWTEIGDSQTSPGSGVNVALEGQFLHASDEQTISASWATSVVGMLGYVEVKNALALSKNGSTEAYDDTDDTTPTPPNAQSGWTWAGGYLYNQNPADRYGHWG